MGRKRLRPWLEDHINKNTFQGLKWIDKEKKIFCIPWKSKKNPKWNASDAQIYKAWAVKSGKLKVGDPENPADWKAQLRMAFHKLPEIEEVKERHLLSDPENPCKVYRFVDKEKKSCGTVPDTVASSSSTLISSMSPLHPFGQHDTPCNPNIPTVVFNDEGSPHSLHDVNRITCAVSEPLISIPTAPVQQLNWKTAPSPSSTPYMDPNMQHINMGNHESPNQFQDIFCDNGHFDLCNYGFTSSNSPSSQQEYDIQSAECCEIDTSLPPSEPKPSLNFIRQPVFEIKVYMLEQCVIEEVVDDIGVRLFHGNLDQHKEADTYCGVYGPMNIKQASMPDVDDLREAFLINEKEKRRVRDVIKNMERGLILDCYEKNGANANNCNIFAKRQCRARVFVRNQEGKTRQLDRNVKSPECVFDLYLFRRQLKDYLEDKGPIPSPSVIFSFGQECKVDFMGQSRAHVYAKVTHVIAEDLLRQEINKKHGDSEVLLSSVSPDDALADFFGDLFKQKVFI